MARTPQEYETRISELHSRNAGLRNEIARLEATQRVTTQPETSEPKPWSYSLHGEEYHGSFPTREEAIQEAKAVYPNSSFYVGECEKPAPDLGFLHGLDILERLADSEDFMIDLAADWFEKANKHADSLGEMMRATFHQWLERNQLHPDFFIVKNPEYILADDEDSEDSAT